MLITMLMYNAHTELTYNLAEIHLTIRNIEQLTSILLSTDSESGDKKDTDMIFLLDSVVRVSMFSEL